MRCPLVFLTMALAGASTMLAAQAPLDPTGFGLGERVGRCLVARCAVIRGSLLTEKPISGSAVRFKITETILGSTGQTDTVDLPYQDPADFQKSITELQFAWSGGGRVAFATNSEVTVVLALEDNPLAHAGDPILVTSNDAVASALRKLAADAKRLESAPNLVSDAVASLGRVSDGPLAGYLFVYLSTRTIAKEPDLAISLLLQLIASPSVPSSALRQIVAELGLDYYGLSPASRIAVIKQLVDLAERPDADAAAAGFYGFAQIEVFHSEVGALITPATISELSKSYASSIRAGRLARLPSVERLLRIN
jgi:hypothetical protein